METWVTTCKCGELINYNPTKLLLETKKQSATNTNEKRMITLTCSYGCKQTHDYVFPAEFKKFDIAFKLPPDIDKPKKLSAIDKFKMFWVQLINSQKENGITKTSKI